MTIVLNKKESELTELMDLATALASRLKPCDVVCLYGDIGAGKTTFARSLIKALVPESSVTSPTFNLVQIYSGQEFDIWHFDLYRLKTHLELIQLGIEEALSYHITIIEWPQLIEQYLPNHSIKVHISFTDNPNTRFITFDKL